LEGLAGEGTLALSREGAAVIEGIEQIVEDGQGKNRTFRYGSSTGSHADDSAYSAEMMAELLEQELLGRVSRNYGEYFGSV
jgi:hypothetical protein